MKVIARIPTWTSAEVADFETSTPASISRTLTKADAKMESAPTRGAMGRERSSQSGASAASAVAPTRHARTRSTSGWSTR
jgi:hypothetical protein